MTYHDGSEPTSSSFSLQSHPGYGPQGISINVEFTLKQHWWIISSLMKFLYILRKTCCFVLGTSKIINYNLGRKVWVVDSWIYNRIGGQSDGQWFLILRQDLTSPGSCSHRRIYFIFCHNNYKINNRNTEFTLQSNVPGMCTGNRQDNAELCWSSLEPSLSKYHGWIEMKECAYNRAM